jgi:hypothetical protein
LLQAFGGEAGLLLVLEDMHWADQDSLLLVEYLADHAGDVGLACVVTARDGSGDAADSVRGLPGAWCELAAQLSLAAGDHDAAARLLLTAGRRAVTAQGALVTAAATLDQARTLAPDGSPLELDIDELRTEVAALAGDVDTAVTVGTGVIDAVAEPARRARMHLRMAEAASAATQWAAAQDHLTAAAELADADDALRVRVDALAAHVLLGAAHPDQAAQRARHALDSAQRLGLAEPACQALEVLGRVARIRDLGEARSAFTRQLRTAEARDLTLWVVRATHELGTIDLLATNRLDRLLNARAMAADAGALSMVATIDLQIAASHQTGFEVPASLEAARRCEHAARRWHLELPLAQALLYQAFAHAIVGQRAAMDTALADVITLDRAEPQVHAAAWASRALYWLLREDREAALDAYHTAMSFDRQMPIITVGPYGGEWALLSTVADRGGYQARAEIRAVTATGACMHEAFLLYADAVAAGRCGDPQQAEALFNNARAKITRCRAGQARRHLAERLVAESALIDGWGQPKDWLTEAAEYFDHSGHPYLARGCRSLLRKAGAPLPRRSNPSRHLSPTLAAAGISSREADARPDRAGTDQQVNRRPPVHLGAHGGQARGKTAPQDRTASSQRSTPIPYVNRHAASGAACHREPMTGARVAGTRLTESYDVTHPSPAWAGSSSAACTGLRDCRADLTLYAPWPRHLFRDEVQSRLGD